MVKHDLRILANGVTCEHARLANELRTRRDEKLTSLDWFVDDGGGRARGGWGGKGAEPAPEPRPPPLLAEVPEPALNFWRRLFIKVVPDSFDVPVEEIEGDLLRSSDFRELFPARLSCDKAFVALIR
jgi:hypothetical protein